MTKEEYAEKLNGMEYKDFMRLDRQSFDDAKENGLIVVFGASDDLMEFRGAIYDECGAGDGTVIPITKDGFFDNFECESGCKYFKAAKADFVAKSKTIKALWCPTYESGEIIASWAYETAIPHAVFNIVEDGEIYCKGIVFSISEI